MSSSSKSISPEPAQIYSRCFRSAPGRRPRFTFAANRERPQKKKRNRENRHKGGGFRRPQEGRQSPEPNGSQKEEDFREKGEKIFF